MKILHTADWHVGRTIRGRSREDEHRQVLAEIAAIAAGEEVDLVLVAGDIFDTASPAPGSEEIVYRALLDLAQVAPVIMVAGNHDHPGRLRAVSPLLELGRVRVGSSVQRPHEGGVISVPGLPVRVAMVPFVTKRGIVRVEQIMSLESSELIGEYADRVARIIEALCSGMTPDAVNILMGHLMVMGGATGGGERQAHLFDYGVPALAFPGDLSYVALGHLHRPQRIAAPAPIWYSGSPLQLDFGEEEDRKSVLLIEGEPSLPVRVESRALTSGKRLRTLRGTLAQLESMVGDVGEAFLRVELEEKGRVGLADDVRAMMPGAVEIRLAIPDTGPGAKMIPRRLGRDPGELFREYLGARNVDDPGLVALFDELLAESQEPESHGPDG
ncbi:MAG TPA: exonuclease SbcCD subunit D [Acidimicrobiia bacterium]|nr:exonuclease SbcCD subunit D [Acidimicrobiia bacterium]